MKMNWIFKATVLLKIFYESFRNYFLKAISNIIYCAYDVFIEIKRQ